MKQCAKCGESKPLSEYYADPTNTSGYKSACRGCYSAASKARYDPQKAKASRDAWYANNRDKRAISCREWKMANREKCAVYSRSHRRANLEADRVRQSMRRARRVKAGGKYTLADVRELFVLQRGRCPVCHSLLDKYHVDHVVPLARGGSNGKENIQLLCPSCNHSKRAKDPVQFMQERGFLL